MIRKSFFLISILVFFCVPIAFAKVKTEKTKLVDLKNITSFEAVSETAILFDRPVEFTKDVCKPNPKEFSCEEFAKKDKVQKDDFIFDCNIKKDDCSSGEKISINSSGIRFRYVVAYHFETSKEKTNQCLDPDQNNKDQPFVENAKSIFKYGVMQGLPFNQIQNEIKKYLSVPYSDGKGNKISRAHCFKVRKGWTNDHFLIKSTLSAHSSFNNETQASECADCLQNSEIKTFGKQKSVVQDLHDRMILEENLNHMTNNRKIRSCEGDISFGNISFAYSKETDSAPCKVDFPKGCGTGPLGNIEFIEQISNGIFQSLGSYSKNDEKYCTDAVNSFIEKCGLNKTPIREAKFEQFQKIRNEVKRVLANERKGSGIKDEMMMCIFKKETFNYDGSKVNTDGCGPRNINNIRNPYFNDPSLHDADEFVNKGWTSSAAGLGQVTLETACGIIKTFPENYKELNEKVKGLLCSSPEAKKIVEPFFIATNQVEALQIKLSIDGLRMKMADVNNNTNAALKNYGDGTEAYAHSVTNCMACYVTDDPKVKGKKRKATDEEAFECLHPSKKNMASIKSKAGA